MEGPTSYAGKSTAHLSCHFDSSCSISWRGLNIKSTRVICHYSSISFLMLKSYHSWSARSSPWQSPGKINRRSLHAKETKPHPSLHLTPRWRSLGYGHPQNLTFWLQYLHRFGLTAAFRGAKCNLRDQLHLVQVKKSMQSWRLRLYFVLIKVVYEVILISPAHFEFHVVLHFQRRMIDPLDIVHVDYCAPKDFDKVAT